MNSVTHMKKRLIHAALATAALAACLPCPVLAKKNDVLFIAVDDMNHWTTLFDRGNPIQPPNLERLAKRGCFFSKAYYVTPACNPSRTAILTGLQPDTSGVYSNSDSWKKLLPHVVTLPQYFKQNEYAAIGGGKIFHHGRTGTDRVNNPSFDRFFALKKHARKPASNYNGQALVNCRVRRRRQWSRHCLL